MFLYEKSLKTYENIISRAWIAPQTTGCIPWDKRAESQISHALLNHTLHSSGIKLDVQATGGEAGVRPYIAGMPELYISLSHCNGVIACAFGDVELGIDAENIRPFDERVMRRICSQEEIKCIMSSEEPNRMFFRYWTLKESYGKAIGVGICYPMKKILFFIDSIKIYCSIKDYTFTLFENIDGYIIALCHRSNK